MAGNAPSKKQPTFEQFSLANISDLLGADVLPRSLLARPSGRRGGRPGNSRCGLVSRHGALPPWVGEPMLPRVEYWNGERPSEMPIGYHRYVSAASRIEADSDWLWERFSAQTVARKGSPVVAGTPRLVRVRLLSLRRRILHRASSESSRRPITRP
jgi:hypothetical protein